MRARRSWQRGLPHELDSNRIHEPSRAEEYRREVRNKREFQQPTRGVTRNSDVPDQRGAHDQYSAVIRRYSGDDEEPPPQPVRLQASNHLRPVAEIGDPGKEEISSARKEVERKACQRKKNAIELMRLSRCAVQSKTPWQLPGLPAIHPRQSLDHATVVKTPDFVPASRAVAA